MSALFGLVVAGFVLWCSYRILCRMGFPGWLAIIALIPVANLIGLFLLATQPWPHDGPPREGAGRWPQ